MSKTKKKVKRSKQRSRARVVVKAMLEQTPAAVNEVRTTAATEMIAPARGKGIPAGLVEVTVKEPVPEGLIEEEIKGTHLKLLAMQDQSAIPTLEQRVAMAKRLNEVGPRLPRYVKNVISRNTTSIGELDMGKKNLAGLDPKEIQKAFDQENKESIEREKAAKKEAAKKAKEEEEKRKKEAVARKKLKTADVTPKANPKTAGGHNWVKQNLVSNKDGSDDYMCENEGCEKKFKRRGLGWNAPAGDCKGKTKGGKPAAKKKDVDPKAQVKGISSPPVKKKAGMEPGKVPPGGFTKDNKPSTSGELIRARIGEHKITDDAIAAEVRKLWPGRTTAVSDVRWNRSQMEKAGVKNVPEPVEGSTVPGKRK